jgi:hypothetical protein
MTDELFDEGMPAPYVPARIRSPWSWWLRRFTLGRLLADRERREALRDVLRADYVDVAAVYVDRDDFPVRTVVTIVVPPGDAEARVLMIDALRNVGEMLLAAPAGTWTASRMERSPS